MPEDPAGEVRSPVLPSSPLSADADELAYWLGRVGPEAAPAAFRRSRALARLAADAGLAPDPGFPALRSGWEEENRRRAAARAAGEPVYGPDRLELDAWLDGRGHALRRGLEARLREADPRCAEPALRSEYASATGVLRERDTLVLIVEGSTEDTLHLHGKTLRAASERLGPLLAGALDLPPGGRLAGRDDHGNPLALRCLSRRPGRVPPFAALAASLRETCGRRVLEDLLDREAARMPGGGPASPFLSVPHPAERNP